MKITEQELRKSQFSYFLGKTVTIQTNAAAVSYENDERGSYLHHRAYGGICEGFDELGVWLIDQETECKSFYFYSQIQGIIENPILPEDHPLVKQALEKAKKQDKPVILGEQPTAGESACNLGEMSIDELQQLLNKSLLPIDKGN